MSTMQFSEVNKFKPVSIGEVILKEMSSEDCVLSFRTSGLNYRTKQMANGDARDLSVTS